MHFRLGRLNGAKQKGRAVDAVRFWLTAGCGARYARSRTRVLLRFRDDVFLQRGETERERLLFRVSSLNSSVYVCRASKLVDIYTTTQRCFFFYLWRRFLVIAF